MTRALWEIIVPAWDEVNGIVAAALPAGAATSSSPALGAKVLDPLRAAVHDRLEGLERALTAKVAAPEVERLLFPLILRLDERVLSALQCSDKLVWHRLQDDVLADEDGGEAFYTRLDHLLRAKVDAQPIVLEVYDFCLADGFQGRLDDAAAIQAYRRRIEEHLGPPPPVVPGSAVPSATVPSATVPSASVPPASPPARVAHPGRSPAFYYVATAILVVLIVALPIALSNL